MSTKIKGIFNVYQTDAWMTKSSYVPKGAFSTHEKAVNAILENGVFDDDWLNEQDDNVFEYVREYLFEHKQTPQCGDINYVIEETKLNEWEG